MDILIILPGLAFGFILLVKGADVMVKSAIQIAVKLKIPQSIIGATFIGFGTSAPELFASTGAALNGNFAVNIEAKETIVSSPELIACLNTTPSFINFLILGIFIFELFS